MLAASWRADHPLLAPASGLDPDRLRDALREAVAGNIVVVDTHDRYAFRHALLREVVDDDLLPGERAELHLRLARALEPRLAAADGAWVAGAIAHHYHEAGDQPAALGAAVTAAVQAERLRAPGEAAVLYSRALELWPRVAEPEAHAGIDHAELLMSTARAHWLNGDDARSLPLLERVVEELDHERERRRAATAVGELARVQWALGRGEESRATTARALALLEGDGPSAVRARLLADRVRTLMLQGRFRETLIAVPEALEAAAAVGDDAVRGNLLNRQGFARIMLGDVDAGVLDMREAIALAGSEDERATGYINLAEALLGIGRGAEAYAVAAEGLGEVGGHTRSVRWLTVGVAEIEIARGDWAAATERLATGKGQLRSGHGAVNEQLPLAELALGRGDDDLARELLDDSVRRIEKSLEPHFIAAVGVLRARLERRAGDLEAARAAVAGALDRIEFCSEDLRAWPPSPRPAWPWRPTRPSGRGTCTTTSRSARPWPAPS